MYPNNIQFYIFDLGDHCYYSEVPITVGGTVNNTTSQPNFNNPMPINSLPTSSIIAKTTQVFHAASEAIKNKLFRVSKLNREILKADFFSVIDPSNPSLTSLLFHKITGDFQLPYLQFLVATLYAQLQDSLFEKSIEIYNSNGGGMEQISDMFKNSGTSKNNNEDVSEDSGLTGLLFCGFSFLIIEIFPRSISRLQLGSGVQHK